MVKIYLLGCDVHLNVASQSSDFAQSADNNLKVSEAQKVSPTTPNSDMTAEKASSHPKAKDHATEEQYHNFTSQRYIAEDIIDISPYNNDEAW